MNKEKLIEIKKIVMYEIGQALEQSIKKEMKFTDKMEIAGILGVLTATLDDKLDDIIQSEPEETCETCTHGKNQEEEEPNDWCYVCSRAYSDEYEKAGE